MDNNILPFIGKDAKKCKELSDEIDNLIWKHIGKDLSPTLISGVIAYRLGAWINHLACTTGDAHRCMLLLDKCKEILDRQVGLK